ncbi:MAG: leucine-rich repeat domain-containing protein [Clostridia bacterium]|nr:leucine-rich repeat domain-containing protein [Clostridia bacterium]
MKKKLILMLALMAIVACLFAITASAGQISGYQQFEVELLDGSVITVYESATWDQWQGRLNFTDNTYTEPPLDTEKTYPKLDWSQVVVADFTNGHRKQLNTSTGEYVETYGTNGGFSMHLNVKSFTKANATSLKTIKTGNATVVMGGALGGFPALEEVIFGERLKEIGYNAFEKNKKLTKIDFSGCENFTTFGWQVFKSCTALETVTLPNTLTNISSSVFDGCTSLKSVVLSTSLTTVDASTFTGCTSLETVSFVGTPSEALKAAAAAAAPNATITTMTACEAYGHSNMTSLNDCMEQCGVCEAIVQKEAPKHNNTSLIEYTNGYESKGTVTYSCTNEGCTHKATEEAPALFTCLGYSAPMSGDAGIAIGFTINNEAVEEYRATGKCITFGVYAVAQQRLGENDIFDENGNATVGVINADLTSYVFDAFEIKIVGFADTQKDIKLSLGAYVTEDGKTYSYLQSDKAGELVGNYYAVTYNSVIASLEANENK